MRESPIVCRRQSPTLTSHFYGHVTGYSIIRPDIVISPRTFMVGELDYHVTGYSIIIPDIVISPRSFMVGELEDGFVEDGVGVDVDVLGDGELRGGADAGL